MVACVLPMLKFYLNHYICHGSLDLVRDPNFSETWKSIPNYFFGKYGGLNFLLRCNYDTNFLELRTLHGLHNESNGFCFLTTSTF